MHFNSETIRRLIKTAKFEEAIEEMERAVNFLNKSTFIDELTLIASSYYYLKGEIRLGKREADTERTKIISGLIDILNLVEEEFYDQKENVNTSHDTRGINLLNSFDLGERILAAKEIDILCYSCRGLFDKYNYHLKNSIKNGGSVRMLNVKPGSNAFNLMLDHTKVGSMKDDVSIIANRVRWLHEILDRTEGKTKGQFQLRHINWIPSTSIILIDKHLDSGTACIRYYPIYYATPMSEWLPKAVFHKYEHPQVFDYYHIQYEHLWSHNDSTTDGFKDKLDFMGSEIIKKPNK